MCSKCRTREAMTDLLAGRVDMIFDYKVTTDAHLNAGLLCALAVSSPTRTPGLPSVPTLVESGFPNLVLVPWVAVFMPVGAPQPIVAKLTDAIEAASNDSKMREFLSQQDQLPMSLKGQEFVDFMKSEKLKWARLVELSGAEKQ